MKKKFEKEEIKNRKKAEKIYAKIIALLPDNKLSKIAPLVTQYGIARVDEFLAFHKKFGIEQNNRMVGL